MAVARRLVKQKTWCVRAWRGRNCVMKSTNKLLLSGLSALAVSLCLNSTSSAQETPPMPPKPEMEEEGERPGPEGRRPGPEGRRPGPEGRRPGPDGERPRGSEGRRRGGAGGMSGMFEELGVNEEQRAKIDAATEEMRKKMTAARESGDRTARRAIFEEFQGKLAEILTPEQMEKMRGMRGGQRGRGQNGRGGQNGRNRGERGGNQRRGGRSNEQVLEEARRALVLGPTEEGQVMPAIEKVLKARTESREAINTQRQELLGFLREGGTEAEIAARLAAFRKARDAAEAKRRQAAEELSGIVDQEQVAKLVALGILD